MFAGGGSTAWGSAATAGAGARTVSVLVVLADSPAASATVSDTVTGLAAAKLTETTSPVLSAVPSPVTSQLAVSASPSESVDVDVSVTGSSVSTSSALMVNEAAGGAA